MSATGAAENKSTGSILLVTSGRSPERSIILKAEKRKSAHSLSPFLTVLVKTVNPTEIQKQTNSVLWEQMTYLHHTKSEVTKLLEPFHLCTVPPFSPLSFLLWARRLSSLRFRYHLAREDIDNSKQLNPNLISLPFNHFISLILFPPCPSLIDLGIHPFSQSRLFCLAGYHSIPGDSLILILTLPRPGKSSHFLALRLPLHSFLLYPGALSFLWLFLCQSHTSQCAWRQNKELHSFPNLGTAERRFLSFTPKANKPFLPVCSRQKDILFSHANSFTYHC